MKRELSLSLNSRASKMPVEAPEGTDAVPYDPFDKTTSASTVGKPRESIISLALTDSTAVYIDIISPSNS
jgi:hypothetical protein